MIWPTSCVQRLLVGRPGVQPGADRRADRVGRRPARRRPCRTWPARPGSAAHVLAASTVAANGSIGSRRSASRVVPGVVGPAGEVEPPAAVRPDALGDADRGAAGRPARCPARRAARRRRRCRPSSSSSGPIGAGSNPAAVIASARLTPAPSRSARAAGRGPSRRSAAGCPGRRARTWPPSSSQNAATATGRAGTRPALAEQVDRGERRTPRRAGRRRRRRRAPSPGGCRSRWPPAHGRLRADPTRPTGWRCGRPRRQVALGGRGAEPGTAGQLGLRERVPAIAAGRIVSARSAAATPTARRQAHARSGGSHRDAGRRARAATSEASS